MSRVFAGAVLGLLSAFLVIAALSVGAGFVLSKERLQGVIVRGFQQHPGIVGDNTHRDYFTECGLFLMNLIRRDDPVANAIVTMWTTGSRSAAGPRLHPCQITHKLVFGAQSPEADVPLTEPRIYRQYLFGSRFLESYVLAVMEYHPAAELFRALTYAAALALFAAALVHTPATALLLAPVIAYLLLVFGMTRLVTLAVAPGFAIGFTLLAFFVCAKRLFLPLWRRVMFFTFLAGMMTYFDILNGPLLVALTLAVVLNHLFYVMPQRLAPSRYLRRAALEPVLILFCFVFAYAVLTALHLALLATMFGDDWRGYFTSLGTRTGDQVDDFRVGAAAILGRFWHWRSQLAPHGHEWLATSMLALGTAAWMMTLGALPGRITPRLLADIGVLAAAAAGPLLWLFVLFQQHTYIHAGFMNRGLTVPAALGLVALLVVFSRPRWDRAAASAAAPPQLPGASGTRDRDQ